MLVNITNREIDSIFWMILECQCIMGADEDPNYRAKQKKHMKRVKTFINRCKTKSLKKWLGGR